MINRWSSQSRGNDKFYQIEKSDLVSYQENERDDIGREVSEICGDVNEFVDNITASNWHLLLNEYDFKPEHIRYLVNKKLVSLYTTNDKLDYSFDERDSDNFQESFERRFNGVNKNKIYLKNLSRAVLNNVPGMKWRCVLKNNGEYNLVHMAGAHTSNWDTWFGIGMAWGNGWDFRLAIKDSYFKSAPSAWYFKKVGCFPIDRAKNKNMVDSLVSEFDIRDDLHLMMVAEGTRKMVPKLKTGFYYTALKAKKPLFLGVLDYKNHIGYGETMSLTGDFEEDFQRIHNFCYFFEPKHKENSYFHQYPLPDIKEIYKEHINKNIVS